MSVARLRQVLLLITFIPWCWLAMMVVHECGHVVAACITGATIEQVVLHPLSISRTDLGENPNPLLVSWTGALVGSVVPLMAWALVQWCAVKWSPMVRFFAGFCQVANGVFLGFGAWTGDGDAGDLLRAGAASWQLICFGFFAIAVGLWLWHGLGSAFALRNNPVRISWHSMAATSILFSATVILEVLLVRVNPPTLVPRSATFLGEPRRYRGGVDPTASHPSVLIHSQVSYRSRLRQLDPREIFC